VSLGLSRDAGNTWQSWTTSVSANLCVVDVDPTNAHDLLLEVWPCGVSASVSCFAQLFRSLDGGHTWRLATFPPAPADPSTDASAGADVENFLWAWQGATLFVSPSPAGTSPQTLVAVSRAQGPFVWVNQTALFAGVPAGGQLTTLSATRVGVFADFADPSAGASTLLTKMSTNQGATWSVFQPQYQGKRVRLLDQGVSLADGHTVLGEVMSGEDPTTGSYVTSPDGGATWTPLAAPPGGLVMRRGYLTTGLVSTPSGVYYAVLTRSTADATAAPGVYRLTPGASTWALVGTLPRTLGGLLAVSWNEAGQPLALWSVAQTPSTPLAGLIMRKL
jgi:hypothetical protein